MNDQELEARLRAWYGAETGEAETAPRSLRRKVAAIPRAASQRRHRLGRGRGLTLLAAAALMLAGGTVAAGSGLVRLPSLVPSEPQPSMAAVPTPSPTSESSAPTAVTSPAPPEASTLVAGPGGVWIPTGTMGTARVRASAVRLLDGRVLVVGGSDGQADLTSAELYNPTTGTWSATGSMVHPDGSFAATLLRDGRVLVSDVTDGGTDHPGYGAELYDPTSGTWTSTGSLDTGGLRQSATLLADGKVLVGDELYDPDSEQWTATTKRTSSQFNRTATLLLDGRVLVVGGEFPSVRAEIYDPDAGSWTATADMSERHQLHDGDVITATLLVDGTVLVQGLGAAELYDPATETWTASREQPGVTGTLATATRLLDGTVLMAGHGSMNDDPALEAALYDPATGSWTAVAKPLHDASSATLLFDGTVLLLGDGVWGTNATGAGELYVPAGVSPPAAVVALPTPTPTPIPTPTPTPGPIPTPYPPLAGPVPAGARSWTVKVVNTSSGLGALFLAEDGENGMGPLCGSVTPNVVPAGGTKNVTFQLPPKRVTDCWLWLNPAPGQGGSMFQTSDAPMAGEILFQEGEGDRAQGGWVHK